MAAWSTIQHQQLKNRDEQPKKAVVIFGAGYNEANDIDVIFQLLSDKTISNYIQQSNSFEIDFPKLLEKL